MNDSFHFVGLGILSLSGHYPRDGFSSLGSQSRLERSDVKRFVRLWLTEGIPFCFVEHPMVYERVREYVADNLAINPNDVSMVGSARLGFSLSPRKFLADFAPGKSDLDLFCISERIFVELCNEFDTGVALWKSGTVAVDANRSQRFRNSEETVARTRQRGFVDSNQIPVLRPDYVPRTTLRCEVMLKRVLGGLYELDFVPRFAKTMSMRVYRSWSAAIQQNLISMTSALQKVGVQIR